MSVAIKQNNSIISSAQKVIEHEANAIKLLHNALDDKFIQLVTLICKNKGKIACSGVGKSGIVAKKISSSLSSIGVPSIYIHPTEASHGDLGIISQNDIMIVFSNSGETEEVFPVLKFCQRFNVDLVAITSNANSTIGKSSIINIALPKVDETSNLPVPTASFTVATVFGDCLISAIIEEKSVHIEHYKNFHPGGSIGAKLLKAEDVLVPLKKLPVTTKQATFTEVIAIISQGGMGCVLVADEHKLHGIITDGDIRRFCEKNLNNNKDATASDLMTHSPQCINKNEYLERAIFIMNSKKITHLPVLHEGKLFGLLHIHSLLSPQNFISK